MQLVEELARPRRIVLERGSGQLCLDGDRDQLLLRAVVQVALDSPPLGIARLDDTCSRGLQFSGAVP